MFFHLCIDTHLFDDEIVLLESQAELRSLFGLIRFGRMRGTVSSAPAIRRLSNEHDERGASSSRSSALSRGRTRRCLFVTSLSLRLRA